ncbi:MAG: hypothetical protein Nkreftii_001684 [Candidatus Nitrospira kreftii]|uniref:Peptidase C39-like domain-containing protein n=1 Tax=Candidatus Nitrospira kreftii TaxID=2652173 RepID=A0A7S8FDM7_9BACT|nr:MAG: hypothetical protein Nkreftii_001684 [Candidatus Nitrospira kreftii]
MNRTLCSIVGLCTLLISGCETKLFTNKINIECAADSPQKAPRGGKFVDQSTLPSKPLGKKPSGLGTPTASRSLLEPYSSGSSSRTRFVIPVQNTTDDYCRTENKEVDAIAQRTSSWCWAASAETVMKYQTNSASPNQCDIVTAIVAKEQPSIGNCCGNSGCQTNGLPSWAFEEYGFNWLMVQGPLEREKLAAQLCRNGPFVFILRYVGGGGHSFVVGDYDYDPDTDELSLWIYDHSWTSTQLNDEQRSPAAYQLWTYESYAQGRWNGEIHEHDVNYVYINPPEDKVEP